MKARLRGFSHRHFHLFIILGICIRILAVIISPEIADSKNAHRFGDIFLQTGSIYGNNQVLYPYPPLISHYLGFSVFLSSKLHLPFVYIFKIPPLLADICIMYLLTRLLKDRKVMIYYALNPLVIVTSSVFGKEDPFVILFAFLAYLTLAKKQSYIISALLLGISFWLKTFTILLLPLFLLTINNLKRNIIFCLIFFIPFLMLILPFVISNFEAINRVYLNYMGSADYGWLAIMKAGSAIISGTSINFTPINNLLPVILTISKYIFASAYVLFVFQQWRSKKLQLTHIILVFLLFYIVYGGIGTNFLFWIIPFLVLYEDLPLIRNYTYLGSLSMTSFILVQFYEPVLKYYNLPILKSPFYTNLFYFLTLIFFWKFLVNLFFHLIKNSHVDI